MNEQDIPIDIHINKLMDWLISRRHCNRDWASHISTVRQKISSAIQDMPPNNTIKNIISGTQINYFCCLQIMEILKETESETKNIFGRYSSQRIKDWNEIIKLYEANNIYLAEVVQSLLHNLNYDIPAMKQRIQALQQMQQECDSDAQHCIQFADELKAKYKAACVQLGIKGKNLKEELMKLSMSTPSNIDQVVQLSHNVLEAIEYYDAFVTYGSNKSNSIRMLPTLMHLIERGNTTFYEWRYGKKPTEIEDSTKKQPSNKAKSKKREDDSDSIDFGAEAIIFGDNDVADINYDISVDDINVTAESTKVPDVASGNDAQTILDNTETRDLIVMELMELEAFLEQRLCEMNEEADVVLTNQFRVAPAIVQDQDVRSVEKMISHTGKIQDILLEDKKQKNQFSLHSPGGVERIVSSLKDKLNAAERTLQKQETFREKKKKLADEQAKLEPQLKILVSKSKELQQQIAKDISKKYSDRRVNLMGGIHTI